MKMKMFLHAIFVFVFLFLIAPGIFNRFFPSNSSASVSKHLYKKPVSNEFHYPYKVNRVIDGDTIEILMPVRYIGINTPEIAHHGKPAELCGKEATEMNKHLVEGKKVRLELDKDIFNGYQRLLAYVYVQNEQGYDVLVNSLLVGMGYAYEQSVYPNLAHKEDFVWSENDAKEIGWFLWNTDDCEPVD